MNIMILGSSGTEKLISDLCKSSTLADKIFSASLDSIDGIPNIKFSTVEELITKAKGLEIDVILTNDENFIKMGIADIFRKHRLNIISANKKWTNIATSKLIAKELMNYHSINTPKIVKVPTEFPVVLKLDNSKNIQKFIAHNIDELISKKQEFSQNYNDAKTFIEEYYEGEEYNLVLLWDGKNGLYFPIQQNLTEVQQERLDFLQTKLNFMFSDEKADFVGFIAIKLLWAKNDWYILEFQTHLDKEDIESAFCNLRTDFLYIINSAIYQKLNEINF